MQKNYFLALYYFPSLSFYRIPQPTTDAAYLYLSKRKAAFGCGRLEGSRWEDKAGGGAMTLAYLASSSVAKFRLAWRIVSSVAMGKLFCSRIRVTSMLC